MKELQDIIAPFGLHTEVKNFDLTSNLDTAIIWLAHIQCPALLVEAARPESLPKFTLNCGRETPAPEPRPLPDPTVQ
jgi:hypothetical protein